MLPHLCLGQFLVLLYSVFTVLTSAESTIYDLLKSNGLPQGLLPAGLTNFTLDNSGKFEVHLDKPCNAKFENELHYDTSVSGTLSYGEISALSGISTQELFLWLDVKEIRVDTEQPRPSLIYFDAGLVSKQYSFSSFETPKPCTSVQLTDLHDGMHIAQAVSKSLSSGNLRYKIDYEGNIGKAFL